MFEGTPTLAATPARCWRNCSVFAPTTAGRDDHNADGRLLAPKWWTPSLSVVCRMAFDWSVERWRFAFAGLRGGARLRAGHIEDCSAQLRRALAYADGRPQCGVFSASVTQRPAGDRSDHHFPMQHARDACRTTAIVIDLLGSAVDAAAICAWLIPLCLLLRAKPSLGSPWPSLPTRLNIFSELCRGARPASEASGMTA